MVVCRPYFFNKHNDMQNSIEKQVASAILEKKDVVINIDGKLYEVAPPSLATLILVSEIVAELPQVQKNENEDVIYTVLRNARNFNKLGEMVAVLILGARGLTETTVERYYKNRLFKMFGIRSKRTKVVDKKQALAEAIMENVRPSVLFDLILRRLSQLEITSFFGLITSLSEANILKATKGE